MTSFDERLAEKLHDVAVVHPTDAVLLKFDAHLTEDEACKIRRACESQGLHWVLVVGAGVDVLISRGEQERR